MHLLDVNLLIALCDADHVHHERARAWFCKASLAGWATLDKRTDPGLVSGGRNALVVVG